MVRNCGLFHYWLHRLSLFLLVLSLPRQRAGILTDTWWTLWQSSIFDGGGCCPPGRMVIRPLKPTLREADRALLVRDRRFTTGSRLDLRWCGSHSSPVGSGVSLTWCRVALSWRAILFCHHD